MYGKSITSWFVTALVFIGILPGGKSKWKDWIRFVVWLAIVTASGCLWFYAQYLKHSKKGVKNLQILYLMKIASEYITPGLLMIGTVLALSTAWKRYPNLIKDIILPTPTKPLVLLLAVMSSIWLVCIAIGASKFATPLDSIAKVVVLPLKTELSVISTAIIGICVAQFQKSLEGIKAVTNVMTACIFGENIIMQLGSLKRFLSPLLFALLPVHTLNLTFYSYEVLTANSNKLQHVGPVMALQIFTSALTVLYICLVLDDCFSAFKSLPKKLRYINSLSNLIVQTYSKLFK